MFIRNSNSNFQEITDLPMYQGDIDFTTSVHHVHDTSEVNTPAKTLIEALGISKLEKLSSTTSYLYLKNKKLKLRNTSLLNYASVRKQAIHEGIVLPSTVKNEDWDAILCHLFENACESEEKDDNKAKMQIMFSDFIEQACEQADQDTRVFFHIIYDHFVGWYKTTVENNEKSLPSKKAVSSHLGKCGIVRKNLGGSLYVFGLLPRRGAPAEL